MSKVLLFLAAVPLLATTTFKGVQTSSTQALLHWTTTSAAACTVEISTAASYTPLVFDVDPALYANANLDSREPYLQTGGQRIFVVGKRLTQRDLTGFPRSRALQAATLHFYRITCGAEILTGTFVTNQPPFGLTTDDYIQPDPLSPGDPLWPYFDYNDKTKAYIDPKTGLQIKRVTGPADQEYRNFGLNIGWAGPNMGLFPASGNNWSAASFPTSITGNNSDYLILHLDSASNGGPGGSDFFNFNTSYTYTAEILTALNNFQTSITGSVDQAACNTTATDDCKLVFCVSVNGVTCHPSSALLEVALTTTSTARTLGDQTFTNQGGWVKNGYRQINSIEAAKRTGNAICDGSTTVKGGPFNLAWTAGSAITINSTVYAIASIQHEAQIALTTACPAGTFGFTAKNLSILVRAKTVSSNTFRLTAGSAQVRLGAAPAAPAGESQDICSFGTVNDNNGNPGYNCTANFSLLWVSQATGEGRNLLPLWVTDSSGFHGLMYQMMSFDGADPDTLYGLSNGNTRFYSYKYKGNHQDAGYAAEAVAAVCNNPISPTNTPCYAITELTAGLTDFADLIHNFNAGFDKTKWVGLVIGTNQHNGEMMILYKRNDGSGGPLNNSYAWLAAFDPHASANSRPGNAGCIGAALHNANPGCVVGAIAVYASPGMRGVDTKGSVFSNTDNGFVSLGPYFTCLNNTQNGGGCWKVDIGGGFAFSATVDAVGGPTDCPANNYGVSGKNCTQVTVSGEPYDANPGPNETGAPGEYITAAPGDVLCISCTTVGGAGTQVLFGATNVELVRLIAKNGVTWTLQRHYQYGFSSPLCSSPECMAGSATALSSGPNPSLWYSGPTGQSYWDFVHDPLGTNLYTDQRDVGSHNFLRNGVMVESATFAVCHDTTISGCYLLRNNGLPATPATTIFVDPTGFTLANPGFAGKQGLSAINGTQSHPSGPGLSASLLNQGFFYDTRPYNGLPSSPQAINVSGSLWKFAAGAIALNRKYLPTHAIAGVHILTDVSGPGSGLGTGAADNYKYCVALAANECQSGSAAGEVYFNVPFLQFNFCLSPGQATSGADNTDVCIHDGALADDAILQLTTLGSDNSNRLTREVTRAFNTPRVNSPFWNIFLTPDSAFGITRSKFVNNYRADLLSVKMPPLNWDSGTRNTFSQTPIFVPASPFGFAVLEWGYAETGTDGVNQFYCSSRRDNCRTGTAPFVYASEVQAPTSCTSGCTIPLPAIGNRVVYYRILRTDSGGSVQATGETRVMAVP